MSTSEELCATESYDQYGRSYTTPNGNRIPNYDIHGTGKRLSLFLKLLSRIMCNKRSLKQLKQIIHASHDFEIQSVSLLLPGGYFCFCFVVSN
mmetsp:Transcript_38480/g.70947  ORF Transcript_38480/g.70947 Transcript_38480/m.70947 type:complete len:93 (-) Transcript_38480:70-348(-)